MTNFSDQFSFNMIQRVKAQEYHTFFKHQANYSPHLNHLNEVVWMTTEEADNQHEFYDYHESSIIRVKKILGSSTLPSEKSTSASENQLRAGIRAHLEEKHLGYITPETLDYLSRYNNPQLDESILDVPISIDSFENVHRWNKSKITPMLMILFIAIFSVAHALNTSSEISGSILIESNTRGATIFLNGEKRGYADFRRLLSDVKQGEYNIELRKIGFTSEPKKVVINRTQKSAQIFIEMKEMGISDVGFVNLGGALPNSRIFVNGDFLGLLNDHKLLSLPEGDHQIRLELDGYRTQPPRQWTRVTIGDTTQVKFKQSPVEVKNTSVSSNRPSQITSGSKIGQGMLSISTDGFGGRIYINGKDSGKESDHVFTGLPFGEYNISIVKDGFETLPQSRQIVLSYNTPNADIDFDLVSKYAKIEVSTTPKAGEIFINGESKGNGNLQIELQKGEYEVSFGTIRDYITPKSRTIRIKDDKPITLEAAYVPKIQNSFTVDNKGNLKKRGIDIALGYTDDDRTFRASQSAGPEVVFYENTGEYYWCFDKAYNDRENTADMMRCTFTLPKGINEQARLILDIAAISSDEQYIANESKKSDVKIRINGKLLRNYFQPKDFSRMEKNSWDITDFIKAGNNVLEIGVTGYNTTNFYVQEVLISNQK